jgi:multisubunit Na+/H+ antiporter MnhE subunit
MRAPAAAWGWWWLLLFALYLLLADSVVAPELVAGAVVAALGATGAVLVRRNRPFLLRPRLGWLRGAWRPLLGLFGDLAPLARALARGGLRGRPPRSGYVELPLEPAPAREDREAAAHQALTEILGSLAPNTLVVDVDTERSVVVAHRLEP